MYLWPRPVRSPEVTRSDPVIKKPEKSQFNIRVETDLLERYREYCDRHGLDPVGQIIIFMKRVVAAEYDFQVKLWDALRTEAE